jgi:muramoyltetrapeptide carboxypeptidase
MIVPPALKKGDTIGVMAPSSYVDMAKIKAAEEFMRSKGFDVLIHPQTSLKNNQSAGTHVQKLTALYDLLEDSSIKAIIAAGGGNRAMHLLDKIDYQIFKDNPKILMGFSDVTALLNEIYFKNNQITFHGPVFSRLPELENDFELNFALLSGEMPDYDFTDSTILQKGSAAGPLIGGNLSLFHVLLNERNIDKLSGAILFLEDINEELSKIDRILLHLKRLGALGKISGLIFGKFTLAEDSGRPFGFSLEDIITEHVKDYDIPVIMNAPFGHEDRLCVFPVGARAILKAENKIELTLSSSPVNNLRATTEN